MSDIAEIALNSVGMLCDYFVNLQKLELEREKLQKAFELDSHKITVCERVALANIKKQKLVLTKSLEISSRELGSLAVSKEILYKSLENLGRDNVQGEEYLTDTVDYLSRTGRRVIPVATDDPEDVLGFNNPAEVLQIEERLQQHGGKTARVAEPADHGVFQSPARWAHCLRDQNSTLQMMLRDIYGKNESLCAEKRQRLLETVEFFIDHFGTAGEVAVIRAPVPASRTRPGRAASSPAR